MKHDATIDIRSDSCPITFVRTKLALEQLETGQVLEVLGRGSEPQYNVPNAVRDHGHEIIDLIELDKDEFRLLIRAVF